MKRNRSGVLPEWGVVGLIPVLPFLYQADYYFNQIFITLFFSLGALAARVIWIKKITVSLSDLVVLVFVATCLLNLLFVKNSSPDTLLYFEGITWIAVYTLARNFNRKYIPALLCAITVSGVLQSLVGLLQYVDFIPSYHTSFKIMGCFSNPGLYGGYLAVSLIACICLFLKKYKSTGCAVILSVCAVFMACMLVLSDSRAAWLACISGLLYLLCKTDVLIFQGIKCQKRIVSLCVIAIAAAVVAGLYGYKKDSADGRLLIWRVSMNMIADAPVAGHGINSFPAMYMNYQGNYFRSHPDAGYQRLSDNNIQAFNEFIKIACELGIIGLAIVITLLVIAFSGRGNPTIIAMLLALSVFSLFSYPMEFFAIGVFFALFIGLCESRHRHPIMLRTRFLSLAVCLIILCAAVCGGCGMIHYNKAFGRLYAQKPDVVQDRNIIYMSVYSKALFESEKYEAFIECVDQPAFPFMTAEIKCDVGSAYWELGDTLKAEAAFTEAMYMVPSKIWPRYLLFTLYKECNKVSDAKRIASVILNGDVKIVGSIALQARREALDYMESMQ